MSVRRWQWDHLLHGLPFLKWLPELKHWPTLRADIIAGLTVVMLLIPQSLAYAQVAGLPAYYGLYAAFIPPVIGALFGSSRSLSTGPVAITSLLTGAALQSLAVGGTSIYIQYVALLTLVSGLIQLVLGLVRMGLVVNFISFPVLTGFTNAAVIIIAASQLGSLCGIELVHNGRLYETLWQLVANLPGLIHWPSLGMGLLALAIIWLGSRTVPHWPLILIAVVVTTSLAWLTNFEKTKVVPVSRIINPALQEVIHNQLSYSSDTQSMLNQIQKIEDTLRLMEKQDDTDPDGEILNHLNQLKWQLERRILRHKVEQAELSRVRLRQFSTADGMSFFYVKGQTIPAGKPGRLIWRIEKLQDGELSLQAGGKVIGHIPQGLPAFTPVHLDWLTIQRLLITALAVALVGFMESIAVAKQIATDSREHLDINQELIGQGLAKVAGAFFQSIPVSGGFSRSVLNFYAGAKTGFSSVVAGLAVMLVLLWFTPLFYYLPIPTLAAIIMYTIFKISDFSAIARAFRINRNEGWVALSTFILTLVLAPRIELAVLLGVLMSLIVYLNETMRPRFCEMIRNDKGELVDADRHMAAEHFCYLVSLVRLGGSLYFANASYFEERILQLIVKWPKVRYIIVDCVSVNTIDASGLEALTNVTRQLEEAGIELWFTRLRQPVMAALRRGSLVERFGPHHFYRSNEEALRYLSEYLGNKHVKNCPLLLAQD
ncbi:MAG: SulP family inorganic anion transporter [Legionellaceae bacterium]|nr:SulP family inorganic anion transporter [Legionellaceae bacterium]